MELSEITVKAIVHYPEGGRHYVLIEDELSSAERAQLPVEVQALLGEHLPVELEAESKKAAQHKAKQELRNLSDLGFTTKLVQQTSPASDGIGYLCPLS